LNPNDTKKIKKSYEKYDEDGNGNLELEEFGEFIKDLATRSNNENVVCLSIMEIVL
jgi:Ca2+-binding EF-hand superfamily protein